MQHLVHRLTLYLVGVTAALIVATAFALFLLVNQLPAEPSPAMVGLLSVLATALAGALTGIIGGLVGAYATIAGSRSVRQLTGEEPEPPAGSKTN